MSKFNVKKEPDYPSLKNLTKKFGTPSKEQNEFLKTLGTPHIESFNYAVGLGLKRAVNDLDTVEFTTSKGDHVSVTIRDVKILKPCLSGSVALGSRTVEVYPTEARQSASSYVGKVEGCLVWTVNGEVIVIPKDLGEVPIMVRSSKCNLWQLTPKELIAKGEHPDEWGGYFISGGHERLVRMLIMTRRNYPLSMKRSSWKSRGKNFSEMGVLMRCVKDDGTSCNNALHYVTDGSARLMFMLKKSQYFIPVILIVKALLDVTDMYIFEKLMTGQQDNPHFKGCVRSMLQVPHREGLHTQQQIKQYIGQNFRVKLRELPESWSDEQICDYLLKRCVLIHLSEPEDKFNVLVFMMHKLWALVQGRCTVDGVDSPMSQEVILGGYLWLQYLKERLQQYLYNVRIILIRESHKSDFQINNLMLSKVAKLSGSVTHSMNNFIATGGINTTTGLGLMQVTGLTIMAENINHMRYMSHFRSVHRGSFFQEMRTTEARQLLPDAWGFICPVHTPDGAPCGLLNHLTKYCEISPVPEATVLRKIPSLLLSMDVVPIDSVTASAVDVTKCYIVMLDGRIIGYIADEYVHNFVKELRLLKIDGKVVPEYTEIGFIPKLSGEVVQYPGVFLFTSPARMMRPVINLSCNRIELIGTLEQLYMDICVVQKEAYPELTTHQELTETSFLSNLACLIPMPDCNQSPRNMYQCQMGKQTMGTGSHTLQWQSEAKMYRLQTPASPLFRPAHYDYVKLDNFAMGTNAIVAVISYTGYDMEDAMVINKAAHDRGFAHGSVYKSQLIPLPSRDCYFGLDPNLDPQSDVHDFLQSDGMPLVSSRLQRHQPLCGYYSPQTGKYEVVKWKGTEEAYIEAVRICEVMGKKRVVGVCILIRIPRNPMVGDKFASRAGQKGICSMLWPMEDLPFTESGLVPDIVFNPHGFPSRMTIAMMIEIMAGKSGAVHGLVHDATPFRFDEKNTAIDYFGRLLEEGGFNYYGTEKMYSGVSGQEMNAEIFFGIVHYQRLRHMVSDKWQVRSTGPIDMLTQQPVKGRKKGGGVRFGEMERDALLSHGASFLLQDRLLHCSDKISTLVCMTCNNIISPLSVMVQSNRSGSTKVECRVCKDNGRVGEMDIPYIYRFLATQLASVNINLKVKVNEVI